jgi:hypothetical protein
MPEPSSPFNLLPYKEAGILLTRYCSEIKFSSRSGFQRKNFRRGLRLKEKETGV